MVAIIDIGTGGFLNPGFAGDQAPVATAIAIVRKTAQSVTIGGSGLANVLSAQWSYGWDQVAGSARIVCATPAGSKGDSAIINAGAGNNVQRFGGTVREIDTTNQPHSVTLICKGPLYALEEYENAVETIAIDEGTPGLDFETLVGGATATLRQIVTAVLDLVGVSYSLGNLDNPSHLYGTLAPDRFTWRTGESAAAYLHRVLEASAGYRLFDSSDGNVYLRQITAIPHTSADFTFTLGQDIEGSSSALDSSIGQRGAVKVQGYDDGSGPATSGLVGSGSSIFKVNSELIETNAFALELANFWLPVVNRPQQVVRLSTPRDDLLGPAQTLYIDAADGLSVNQKMWLKSYTGELAANGAFSQLVICVAGAAA